MNWDVVKNAILYMTPIGLAFQALSLVPWDKIASGLETVKNAILGFIDGILAKLPSLKNPFVNPNGKGGDEPVYNSPMRYDGGAPDKGLAIPANFNPATKTLTAQPISFSLNVDGRVLAQTVSNELEYLYEHATGAPSYDGMRRHIPADGGMVGT